jgi:hypothetical protein
LGAGEGGALGKVPFDQHQRLAKMATKLNLVSVDYLMNTSTNRFRFVSVAYWGDWKRFLSMTTDAAQPRWPP